MTVERADGTALREHLDVGENPPNGAIVYYWLAEDASGPVTLTFRDAAARRSSTLRSDDDASAAGAAPGDASPA